MIFAIYKMPTNPLLSFIFTLSSGILDGIDGNFARYLHQTSKVGMLFDISIDRFTNLAQMFFLTRLFPKYCTIFLFVGFMELVRDLAYWVFAYYSLLFTIFNQFSINKNDNLTNFRKDIYDHLFFNKKPPSNEIIRPHGMFIHEIIYPLIWYSSDLFYWIIYIAGFSAKTQNEHKKLASSSCSSQSSSICSSETLEDLIISNEIGKDDPLISSDNSYLTPFNIEGESKVLLIEVYDSHVICKKKKRSLLRKLISSAKHFIGLFEFMGKNLDDYFESNIRFKMIIKFQMIFNLVGIYFLIGAILKFYLSTYEFLLLTYDLVLIDMKSVDIASVVKLNDFFKN